MATIKFDIDIPPQDRELIASLGRLADKTLRQRINTQVYAVRGRTLDQIKRLYAVVMGFALTTCIANAYLCFRRLEQPDAQANLILVTAVFAFVSLIPLFYLGAERMLEQKYLQLSSEPASGGELFGDILTLWVTAGWFVVIANSFPLIPATNNLPAADVHSFFPKFLFYLIILYVLDVVFLLMQMALLRLDAKSARIWEEHEEAAYNKLMKAHKIWIGANLVTGAIIAIGWWFFDPSYGTAAAWTLIVIQAARFLVDYTLTFESYYPQDEIKAAS